MKNKNLVGTEINNLKIISYINDGNKQYFEYICVCGNKSKGRIDSIKAGTTKSCGCLSGDFISQKNRLPNNEGTVNLVLRHYKGNAKKRNLDFSLSKDEFKLLINNNCYYCGALPEISIFTSSSENRRDRELVYNGIDRINNSLGYFLENCVSCCFLCNSAKSDLDHVKFLEWIKRLVIHNNGK